MNRTQAIEQLKSLQEHCKEMARVDKEIWWDDVAALRFAIDIIGKMEENQDE